MQNTLRAKKDDILKYSAEPTTLNELAQVVIDTINRTLHIKGHPYTLVGFAWQINHCNVSTSHNQPIDIDRNFETPRHCPGWYGRLWVRFSSYTSCPGSSLVSPSLTYTGTGGYGHYAGPWKDVANTHFKHYGNGLTGPSLYSWDYRFFDSDWPLINEVLTFEKNRVWSTLKNQRPLQPGHKFEWLCPDVKAADEEFLKKHLLLETV